MAIHEPEDVNEACRLLIRLYYNHIGTSIYIAGNDSEAHAISRALERANVTDRPERVRSFGDASGCIVVLGQDCYDSDAEDAAEVVCWPEG